MPEWKDEIRQRLASLHLAPTREAEIIEELSQHLDDCYRESLAGGATPAEARRRMLAELNESELLGRELRRTEKQVVAEPIVLGTNRRKNMITDLWQDLRYGARMLLKQPGFTFIAVFTLALGIGANTAIFSVVNGILLKPLPYQYPENLVQIWETDLKGGLGQIGVSPPDFLDWKKQNDVFEDLAAYTGQDFNLTGDGQAERIFGARVTPNLLSLLGVSPILGSGFFAGTEEGGSEKVAVLSHGLWQRRFGASSSVTGDFLVLNGERFTILGVMPPGFQFPSRQTEIWIPLDLAADRSGNTRMNHSLQVIARLKRGANLQSATLAMEALARNLAGQYPESNSHIGVRLVDLHDQVVGNVKPALLALLAAVGLVLLMACANIGSLMLTHAVSRQNEIGVRIALGAGRARLIRQLLTENLLLSLLGGGLGVLVGIWGVRGLVALSPANTPRLNEIGVDFRVLAFTVVLSLAAGILFGLLPALETSKVDLNSALKTGGRGASGSTRHRRSTMFLVVAEIALAVVLLIGAGLLIQSFLRLQGVDPGFEGRNVLIMRLRLTESNYRTGTAVKTFYRQLLERGHSTPGVLSIGATTHPPFVGSTREMLVTIEGRPDPGPGAWPVANSSIVTPRYFHTLGIPIRLGRDFSDEDREGIPGTVIISESLARRYWPDADPIGKRIKLSRPQDDAPWLTIVGMVGDIRHAGLRGEPKSSLYLPYLGVSEQTSAMVGRYMTLVVRTESQPEKIANALRAEIMALDHNQPVYGVTTLESVISGSLAEQRLRSWLLGLFSGAALLLAALGVYGILAVMVSQRRQEIGMRLALGARPQDIFRLVTRQGLVLATTGILIGLPASLAITRLLSGLLYHVGPLDPLTFISVPVILLVVAWLACWIPARRAAKLDPLIALRCE